MTRPNLLVLFADQLRRDALSVYGDPNITTSNIDGLAQRGVRFLRACSTYPICVPFRFSLMTGEYAHTRFVPGLEWRMSPAERTLADEFNDAGYHTAYVGKWHLYGSGHILGEGRAKRRANRTPVPRLFQGRWQKWLGFELANAPFDTCYFEDDDPTPRPLGKYQTDGLFDLAMNHLRQHDRSIPFACIVSVEPPHFPMEAPRDLEEKWLRTELQLPANFLETDAAPLAAHAAGAEELEEARARTIRHRQLYYAMVENFDQNVGRMLRFLEGSGLLDNSIVVLMSDHGEMGGAHNLNPIAKQHPFEESIGIPLIVYDPRQTARAGAVSDEPVCTEDLYPTLLGLCGLTPIAPKPGCDVAPLIRGEVNTLPREGVLLEFVHDLRANMPYHDEYWRGFCGHDYKYTVLGDAVSGGRPWQFFDLKRDPGEQHNLVGDPTHQDMVSHFHRLLYERLVETHDHFVLARAYGCDGLNLWDSEV